MNTCPSSCPYCGAALRSGVPTCSVCGQAQVAWSVYQGDGAAAQKRPLPDPAIRSRGTNGSLHQRTLATKPFSSQRPYRLVWLLSIVLVLLLLLLGFGLLAMLAHQQAVMSPQRQATPPTSQNTPLARPAPVIVVSSLYHVGTSPAGAMGTTLQVSGEQFTPNAEVTFLLDGAPAPGARVVQSDNDGQAQAEVAVTANWSLGTHILTAREVADQRSSNGVTLMVVSPGQASTPGPNGAPADSVSFALALTVSPVDASTRATLPSFYDTLTVLGRPDPSGGVVCDPQHDTGKPIETTSRGSGPSYVVTYVATCSGTYIGGKITYTETATSFQIVYASGLTCQAQVPVVLQSLEGSFLDARTVNGTFRADALDFTCSNGQSSQNAPQTGTWSGTIAG